MSKSTVGEVMITEEQIRARAAENGKEISEEFAGKEMLVVGILKGAVLWLADVVKNIDNENLGIDFMVVSSYGSSTKSSGVVKIVKDLDSDIAGKIVIIVEDIVDSGITLSYLKRYLSGRNAKAVKICTLLDKPEGSLSWDMDSILTRNTGSFRIFHFLSKKAAYEFAIN